MAKFRISGVPITEGRKLVGIITNRDLKFETDFYQEDQRVHDQRRTDHRSWKVSLWKKRRRSWQRQEKRRLPIVDKDFNLKGLITIKDIEKTIKYPLAAKGFPGQTALRCRRRYHRKRTGSCGSFSSSQG